MPLGIEEQEENDMLVRNLIEKHGGCVLLSELESKYPRIRRAHLKAAGFVFGEANSSGDRYIAMPEDEPPPVPDEVAIPTTEIIQFLNAFGGQATFAFVCGHFKLKKVQLESEGFVFGRPNQAGRFNVAPPGGEAERPDDESIPLEEIIGYLEANGGYASSAVVGSMFQLKKAQMEHAGFVLGPLNSQGQRNVSPPGYEEPPRPSDSPQNEYARRKKPSGGGSEPPVPSETPARQLPSDLIRQIKKKILEDGGYSHLARLCSDFKVTKAQLVAECFVLSATSSQGQRNVAVPGSRTPKPPEESFASNGEPPAKRARKGDAPAKGSKGGHFAPSPSSGKGGYGKGGFDYDYDLWGSSADASWGKGYGKGYGAWDKGWGKGWDDDSYSTGVTMMKGGKMYQQAWVPVAAPAGKGSGTKAGGKAKPSSGPASGGKGAPRPSVKHEPSEPLGEDIVEAISSYLLEQGGQAPFGSVFREFRAKKGQLEEAGFLFSESNAKGQRNVGPPGYDIPEVPL